MIAEPQRKSSVMADIAFYFDFTRLIIAGEVLAFVMLFAGWWVRRRSVPRGLVLIAIGLALLVAAPALALLE